MSMSPDIALSVICSRSARTKMLNSLHEKSAEIYNKQLFSYDFHAALLMHVSCVHIVVIAIVVAIAIVAVSISIVSRQDDDDGNNDTY